MHLGYDDDFVEAAVFHRCEPKAAWHRAVADPSFHAERERCYDILEPDGRPSA